MSEFIEIHATEGWMSELANPPMVDGVALLLESCHVLRVMLYEHDRPGLHKQIKRGAWEACQSLATIPGAEPLFDIVSAFNEEIGNPPYDPDIPGPIGPEM